MGEVRGDDQRQMVGFEEESCDERLVVCYKTDSLQGETQSPKEEK